MNTNLANFEKYRITKEQTSYITGGRSGSGSYAGVANGVVDDD